MIGGISFQLNSLTYNRMMDLNYMQEFCVKKQKTNKLAIVVHGFMNNYKDMQTYAKYFYDNGYNVLTVDNRAHGLSGGEYVGMGWFDRLDIVKWIDYVIQKVWQKSPNCFIWDFNGWSNGFDDKRRRVATKRKMYYFRFCI